MMNFNLILPAAIDKFEYEIECPYLFEYDDNKKCIPILQSLHGIDLERFSNIYIVLLRKHELLYNLSERIFAGLLQLQNAEKFSLVFLDTPTCSQAETVYRAIKQENIIGSVMVKDADSCFSCDVLQGNSIAIYPLDALIRVNPQHKSYVALDDFFNITNVIEKKIISRYFCVGGYFFRDAADFQTYYEKLYEYSPFYMSFLVFSMLLDGVVFRPIFADSYQDWGTKDDWNYYLSRQLYV